MGIGLFGNTKVKPIQKKEYWTKRFMPLKDHKNSSQRFTRELSVEKLSYF
jgi:hypothetical protein